MTENYIRLLKYMDGMPVFNTHSHHYPHTMQSGMDLMRMLHLTYLKEYIAGEKPEEDALTDFIERMKYNSYFVWLERGMEEIYGIKAALHPENMVRTNAAIIDAYKEKTHSISILEKNCCYRYMIVDAYWNPGEIESMSDIFISAYRINMYLYGYDRGAADHNGNNPYQVNNWSAVNELDEYIHLMHEEFRRQLNRGCAALKCASAYDRGVDFKKTKKEDAQKAFESGKTAGKITKKEIEDFQNYIFYDICEFAAEYQIPLQCHTGLGLFHKTSALYLREAIEDNQKTKFVLFHGSYPWMDDLCGLVCTYHNVYIDFCWLPIISTFEAKQFLEKILDIGDITKIYWGCDTWIAEDSYGALLAMKHVLGSTLGSRIDKGLLSCQDAENICKKILYQNACQLYLKDNKKGLINN